MRALTIATAICCTVVGLSTAAAVDAAMRKPTSIPAQGLEPALDTLAKQRDLQVVYRSEVVGELRSPGAAGELTADEALQELLDGTGLTFQYLDEKTVTIVPVSSPLPADEVRNGKKVSMSKTEIAASMRLAQTETPSLSKEEARSEERQDDVQEIIVTAQKREERLQDVPVPVSVISADSLVERNQLRLQDYYASIPGLSLSPALQSAQSLSIRGISTGSGNPTVGVMVDDMPYGSSTFNGGANVVPDIDPGDLARVEVLRGPQGTLYGASSMGGLLKFVTVDPSTDRIAGSVRGGFSAVQNGDEVGYNARGSLNLPLGNTFAVRASAFTRLDPGYIDNPGFLGDPTRGAQGVNRAQASGGQVSALWKPADLFSLKLSGLLQKTSGDGSSLVYVQSGLGDLQQGQTRGVGEYDRETQSYSATVKTKLGDVDLTSVSGYNINSFSDSFDFGTALAAQSTPLFGVANAAQFNDNETRKFSQEIRLVMPIGERLEWLVGGFYTHEDTDYRNDRQAINPLTGLPAGSLRATSFPTTLQEYAVFTNLTYTVTDRFDIQVGVRESKNSQTFTQTQAGPIVAGGIAIIPEVDTSANAFTYLLTPRFKISPDLMAYARLASGYRAGGANTGVGVPRQYDPDKTQNYELGIKGDFLDHTLSVDASLYYIDWKNIQLTIFQFQGATINTYTANAGRAKSQGVELSVESRPLTGLVIAGWVAWNDSVLTENFPAGPLFGVSDDRLPYASRFTGNISVDGEFPFASTWTGFVGGSVSFVGDRLGGFQASPTRQYYPSYTQADLRAGLKQGSWTLNLFVNNIGNERGLLKGGSDIFPTNAFIYNQPRTIGLSLANAF